MTAIVMASASTGQIDHGEGETDDASSLRLFQDHVGHFDIVTRTENTTSHKTMISVDVVDHPLIVHVR
jgi:hypothetical protein